MTSREAVARDAINDAVSLFHSEVTEMQALARGWMGGGLVSVRAVQDHLNRLGDAFETLKNADRELMPLSAVILVDRATQIDSVLKELQKAGRRLEPHPGAVLTEKQQIKIFGPAVTELARAVPEISDSEHWVG